jgi:protein-tyrosine-phosphatase/DNA-binding transcriptional ArsR family regulator
METKQAAAMLSALAQETRLDLLRLLFAHGASGLPAGEIGEALGVPPSTLSFHLSALEREGLLRATRQGRRIIYAVRMIAMRELLGFLTETCCAGQPGRCGDLARLLPASDEEPMMTPAFNVLFLCTANSARSVMAESILNSIGGGRFRAFSAGSAPAAQPRAEVLEKLAAVGHDPSKLRSKSWNEFIGPDAPQMDFVIALCDTLDGQVCPEFGDKAITGAWPLPDSGKFSRNPAERATLMNELYASLHRRLSIFINLPFTSLDRMAARKRLDEIGSQLRVGT